MTTDEQLHMEQLNRLLEVAGQFSDSAAYAFLEWCYDLHTPVGDALVEALSVRLILSAARTNPVTPTAIRWIEADWDTDGLCPTHVIDSEGRAHRGVDYTGDLWAWVSNLRDPQRFVPGTDENGPFRIDLHQFPIAALGEFWAEREHIAEPPRRAELRWLVQFSVQALIPGTATSVVNESAIETAQGLGYEQASEYAGERRISLTGAVTRYIMGGLDDQAAGKRQQYRGGIRRETVTLYADAGGKWHAHVELPEPGYPPSVLQGRSRSIRDRARAAIREKVGERQTLTPDIRCPVEVVATQLDGPLLARSITYAEKWS